MNRPAVISQALALGRGQQVNFVNDPEPGFTVGLQFALGGANGAQGGPIKWRKVQIRAL